MYGQSELRERSSGRTGDFLAGVICGAAIGAAVGLLLATKPGEELREQIADSARRFRRKVSDTYGQAADGVNDVLDRSREAVRRGREEFHDFVDEKVTQAKDASNVNAY
jgi:gas vesicle protein